MVSSLTRDISYETTVITQYFYRHRLAIRVIEECKEDAEQKEGMALRLLLGYIRVCANGIRCLLFDFCRPNLLRCAISLLFLSGTAVACISCHLLFFCLCFVLG